MGVFSKAIVHEDFTQYYITAGVRADKNFQAAVEESYSEIGEILRINGIAVLQEKIYGLTKLKSEILDIRNTVLSARGCDSDTPHMFVDGAPVGGIGFAGIHIWGISRPQEGTHSVKTVTSVAHGDGRMWESDRFTLLWLPNTSKPFQANNSSQDKTLQARRMYNDIESHLAELGFDFSNVVRTWIYLPRLLDWYVEFNAVRCEFFRSGGIDCMPASTCIQGRCDDRECAMDLIAVKAKKASDIIVSPVRRSSRQNDAFAYGSSFSRAVCLVISECTILYCSGTAAINLEGATVGLNDPGRQCEETFANAATLLYEHGGDLENVVSATLFCKNQSVVQAWKQFARNRLPAGFPLVVVYADICREELLVEIEMTAVIPRSSRASFSKTKSP